jgi:hypothetical protein
MSVTHPKKFGSLAGSRIRRKASQKPGRPVHHAALQALKPRETVRTKPEIRIRHREPHWAAWSGDLSRIIAYGATPEEARDAARAKGEMEPALEPVQSRHRQA